MNKWLVVPAAIVVAAAAAGTALRAEDPVPPEIQALFDKVHAGKPLTPDEQKKLDDWGLRHRNETTGGMTFDDVMAIINSARATGKPPSDADQARIKAWSLAMQGKKDQLEKDAADLKRRAGTAGGTRRPTPADIHDGTVRFKVTQHVVQNESHGDDSRHADVNVQFDVTYPVKFDVHDEGERGLCRITWRTGPSDKAVMGTFGQNVHATHASETETLTSQFAIREPVLKTGAMTDGEVVVAHGGRRPYAEVTVLCPTQGNAHTHIQHPPDPDRDSDTKVVAMLPFAFANDGILEEAPLQKSKLPPKSMPDVRRLVLEKLPPEIKKPAEGAHCTFDVASFRAQWQKGQAFRIPVKYDTTFDLRKTGEGGDEGTTVTSNAVIELQFGERPSVLSIEPASRAAYEAWLPVPFTSDEKVAHAFDVQVEDDAVTIPIVVQFKSPVAAAAGAQGTAAAAGGSGGQAGAGAGATGAGSSSPVGEDDAPNKGIIELRWSDVSENKGICTNYPPENADVQKGLFFPRTDPKFHFKQDDQLEISEDGTTARTKVAVSSITIKVAARESGAYGTLVAECPELEQIAEYTPAGTKFLQIPQDDDHNNVADGWMGNKFKGRARNWDDDAKPSGQRRNGDGLTLYEEYRGFFVLKDPKDPQSWHHIRTDPDKKDLFVCDRDGLILEHFAPHNNDTEGPNFDLHFVTPELIRIIKGVDRKNPPPEHRQINNNSSITDTLGRQYAIHCIVTPGLHDENGPFEGGALCDYGDRLTQGRGQFEKPLRDTTIIEIDPALVRQHMEGLITAAHGLVPGSPVLTPAQIAACSLHNLTITVIHEVGHAIGIHHHFVQNATIDHDSRGNITHWPGDEMGTMWGCLECPLRYTRTHRFDVPAIAQGNYPVRARYCHNGDTAEAPTGLDEVTHIMPPEKTYPCNDGCWEQIDVKTNP